MKAKRIKQMILDTLRSAEEVVEQDLQKDEQSRKTSGYLISLFKLLGLDLVERLVDEAKLYVEGQIQKGIEKFAHGLSGVVAYVMMLMVLVTSAIVARMILQILIVMMMVSAMTQMNFLTIQQ